jgi:acetyl-CoA acyltransferase 1
LLIFAFSKHAEEHRLKPAFDAEGTTTAGNSSQVSDGAAAVLLMKRGMAKKLGLPIQATFRSFSGSQLFHSFFFLLVLLF